MKTQEIIDHLQSMQAQIDSATAWDSARKMVINHLMAHHELEDPYQWAYKTIEIFKEYEELKTSKVSNQKQRIEQATGGGLAPLKSDDPT